MPQGSILGSLWFSFYRNDLHLAFPEVQTQMYADDAVLYNNEIRKQEEAD